MTASPSIRLLTRADLAFADSLRAVAGWNQTLQDWQRSLELEPAGCFLAESGGLPVGTATTLIYGPDLAWIGMVLVHPDYRRRGIGRALLRRCIDHLQARRIRCIKLDATPAGKQVYDGLGFLAEWTFTRWEHTGPLSIPPALEPQFRSWRKTDAELIESLDAAAFGVSRTKLLRALGEQSADALIVESSDPHATGYGMLRAGSRAAYLGPVGAVTADAARQIVEIMLQRNAGPAVFWDIPDDNIPAVQWAKQHGFVALRSLTRMYLGENRSPGDPLKQYAIAGPETG